MSQPSWIRVGAGTHSCDVMVNYYVGHLWPFKTNHIYHSSNLMQYISHFFSFYSGTQKGSKLSWGEITSHFLFDWRSKYSSVTCPPRPSLHQVHPQTCYLLCNRQAIQTCWVTMGCHSLLLLSSVNDNKRTSLSRVLNQDNLIQSHSIPEVLIKEFTGRHWYATRFSLTYSEWTNTFPLILVSLKSSFSAV